MNSGAARWCDRMGTGRQKERTIRRSLLGTRGTGLFGGGGDGGRFAALGGALFNELSGDRRDSGGIGDVLIYGVVIVTVIRVLDQEEVVVLFALVLAGGGVARGGELGKGGVVSLQDM